MVTCQGWCPFQASLGQLLHWFYFLQWLVSLIFFSGKQHTWQEIYLLLFQLLIRKGKCFQGRWMKVTAFTYIYICFVLRASLSLGNNLKWFLRGFGPLLLWVLSMICPIFNQKMDIFFLSIIKHCPFYVSYLMTAHVYVIDFQITLLRCG